MTVYRRIGWAIVGVAFTIVVICLSFSGIRQRAGAGSDPDVLVRGVRVAFDCIRDRRFTHCGPAYAGRDYVTAESVGKIVGPFPLLQYLPASVAVGFGASVTTALNALAWLNVAAFAGMFGLILLAGQRLPSRWLWTPILLAIVASGPLYFYATAEFGEMLAATALLGAVVAALYRRPWLLGLTAMIASLGKETLPPFILVLVIVAARDRFDGVLPRARLTVAAIVGTASAVALSALFNVFRFGTPTNRYYLEPALRAVGSVRGSFFGAVFAAPNGGLVWFWTPALLLVIIAGAWALSQAVRSWRNVREWGPTLVIVGLVVVWGSGLAAWFSPFGWVAWGPRLFIPLIPAAMVAVAHAGGPAFADVVRRGIARPIAVALLIATAIVCVWFQAAAPWTWPVTAPVILTTDSKCPTWPNPWSDPVRYQQCEAHVAWRLQPSILGRSLSQQSPPSVVTGAAAVVGIVTLAALTLRRPSDDERDPDDGRKPSLSSRASRSAEKPNRLALRAGWVTSCPAHSRVADA